jgi:hypothetical protein
MNTHPNRSPKEALLAMATGYRTTQALYVVAKLGIADLLFEGPKNAQQLAKKVGANPQALFRVMRALAALGVFTQNVKGMFALSPTGDLLRAENPQTLLYNILIYGNEHYKAAGDLLHTVITGETAFNHVYGKNRFEYLIENSQASAIFNAAMAQGSRRLKNPLESYNFKDRRLVVDVGGGRGDVMASILRGNPEMKGILFDLPAAVSGAEANLKKLGVAGRCKIITGSAFGAIPAGGDIYLTSRFLHNFADVKAISILSNCRKAISKQGILLLRESVLGEGSGHSIAKQVDLVMLFLTEGKERTEPEWGNILKAAGFCISRILKRKGYFDLIEANQSPC